MPNLSVFLSKPLLMLFEAKLENEISGGLINIKTNKLEYIMFGENPKRVVSPKRIECFGDNANVLLNDLGVRQLADVDCARYIAAPLGKTIFTTDGKAAGLVTDVEIDAEFIATSLFAGSERIPIEQVVTFGDELVLIKGEWCPKIAKKVSGKIRIPKVDNVRVKILEPEEEADESDEYPEVLPLTLAEALRTEKTAAPETIAKTETSAQPQKTLYPIVEKYVPKNAPEKTAYENDLNSYEGNDGRVDAEIADNTAASEDEKRSPERIISNYGFLLGRLVTKNLFSFNNELLALEGEVITTKLVEKVRRAGKLVELTLNSKN